MVSCAPSYTLGFLPRRPKGEYLTHGVESMDLVSLLFAPVEMQSKDWDEMAKITEKVMSEPGGGAACKEVSP